MAPDESQAGYRPADFCTAAVLTPAGRGAVATVSVRGRLTQAEATMDLHFSAANGLQVREQPLGRICFGHWSQKSGLDSEAHPPEEVVLSRRDNLTVEICCHGGPAAADQILSDLRHGDIRTVTWQDHVAADPEMSADEFHTALLQATTRRAVLKLLEQKRVLADQLTQWMAQADSAAVLTATIGAQIDQCLEWLEYGLHLTTPWRVVLAGRPNVGKSSLLNALAGFRRAIVYAEPGTTRDVVSVETAFEGWPVLLFDTAGLRVATDEIEREGVSRSRQTIEDADCVCLLLDSASPLTPEDRQLISDVETSATPAVFVASRSDLGSEVHSERLPVSAVTGRGLEDLIAAIVGQLVPAEPPVHLAVPITGRQVQLLTSASQAAKQSDRRTLQANLQQLISGTGPDTQGGSGSQRPSSVNSP
ncbi:MAG: GTPase [Planctomycetaceae bacterium]